MKTMIKIFIDIETTGLNPWYDNQVTCICAEATNNENFKEVSYDEEKLLKNFFDWIQQFSPESACLVLANGKDFDIPFLSARASKYFLKKYFWSLIKFPIFDLCTDTIQGEYGKISLNKLAKLYGIKQKLANGKDAIRWFKEKNYSQILRYCEDDVRITKEVYEKFNQIKEGEFAKSHPCNKKNFATY
jgi:uncharacterized protein YprB with RNaseH-like and TPR domain